MKATGKKPWGKPPALPKALGDVETLLADAGYSAKRMWTLARRQASIP
jgi:hypothetical protein